MEGIYHDKFKSFTYISLDYDVHFKRLQVLLILSSQFIHLERVRDVIETLTEWISTMIIETLTQTPPFKASFLLAVKNAFSFYGIICHWCAFYHYKTNFKRRKSTWRMLESDWMEKGRGTLTGGSGRRASNSCKEREKAFCQ